MAKNRHGWSSFKRLLRYRLVIPIERNLSRPREVARGTALGLGVGLTPTVGLQIVMVTCIWSVIRVAGVRANLASALAWTWISNPITMFPLYFVFYLTGEVMLLRTGVVMSYRDFSDVFSRLLTAVNLTYRGLYQFVLQALGLQSDVASFDWHEVEGVYYPLFDKLIYPIFLGSVPWMLAGFVCGYILGATLVKSLLAKRKKPSSA